MRRFEGDPWKRDWSTPSATPTFAPQLEGTELLGVAQQPKRAQARSMGAPRMTPPAPSATSGLISTGAKLLNDYLNRGKKAAADPAPYTPGIQVGMKGGGEVKGKTQNTKQPQIPKGTPKGGTLKVKK